MLSEVLDSKEEKIQKYLESNKKILIAAFGTPEYISDFVILTDQSYSYSINLIELEPATKFLQSQEIMQVV